MTHRTALAPVEMLENRTLLSGSHWMTLDLPSPNLAATADFNGDKKADLVTVSRGGNRNHPKASVLVQLGTGKGVFIASSLKMLPGVPSAVVTGDFNGDSNADVGVLSVVNGNTSIQILPGNGKGGFGTAIKQNLGVIPTVKIAGGDINADGFADLVAWSQDYVWVSLNDGAGTLATAFQQDNPFGSYTPVGLGDFFGDGRYELIGTAGTGVLGNMALAATGQFMLTFLPTIDPTLNLDDKRVVMADVNGDGKQDLIALGADSVNVALQVVDPTAFAAFGPWAQTTASINPATTLVGDLDGDGKADLFREGLNLGLISFGRAILISNGDGTFHKLLF